MACPNTDYPDLQQNDLTDHVYIKAAGSSENQAMLRGNRKLSYEIELPWIAFKAVPPTV